MGQFFKMFLCKFCDEDIRFNENDFDSDREAFIEHLSDKHQVNFNFDFVYFTSLVKPTTLVKLMTASVEGERKQKQTKQTKKIRTREDGRKGKRYPGAIYKCDKCDYLSMKLNGLSMHKNRRHSNIRPKICFVCTDAFLTKQELKNHMIVHSTEKMFKCDICPSTFKHKSTQRTHAAMHAGIFLLHNCEQCEKTFKTSSHLGRHATIHTGARPFKCYSCSSSFGLKEVLKEHIKRMHTNIR